MTIEPARWAMKSGLRRWFDRVGDDPADLVDDLNLDPDEFVVVDSHHRIAQNCDRNIDANGTIPE